MNFFPPVYSQKDFFCNQFFQSCITDVKMNHVRGSGAGDKIRASHSQSDPVAVGKNQTFTIRYPKEIMKMERHFSALQRWLQK